MFGVPASRLHRFVGGLSLILAPLLFAWTEVTYPAQGDGNAEMLAAGAAHSSLFLADIYVGVASSIFFVIAYFALLSVLRERGSVLAHIAFVLGLLGTCLSGLVLAGLQLMFWAMTAPGVDRASMAAFLDRTQQLAGGAPVFLGRYLFIAGLLLFGVAVWRARFGYRWAGPLAILGLLLDIVLGSIGVEQNEASAVAVGLLTDGMLVIGLGAIGWHMLRMPDVTWAAPATTEARGSGAAARAQA